VIDVPPANGRPRIGVVLKKPRRGFQTLRVGNAVILGEKQDRPAGGLGCQAVHWKRIGIVSRKQAIVRPEPLAYGGFVAPLGIRYGDDLEPLGSERLLCPRIEMLRPAARIAKRNDDRDESVVRAMCCTLRKLHRVREIEATGRPRRASKRSSSKRDHLRLNQGRVV
jgi:hypothetical protein